MEDNSIFCGEGAEDVLHALYQCPRLRQCWDNQCLFLPLEASRVDFADLARKVQARGSKEELEKFFLIAWGFWYRRNQIMYENKEINPTAAVHNALSSGSKHKQVKCVETKSKGTWTPPQQGSLKLNVDGAIFHDQQRAVVGVILGAKKGEVLLAGSKKEFEVNDPIEIELLAILKGLQLCLHSGIPNLVIESDSLVMVRTIQNIGANSMSSLGNVIKEIQELMKSFHQC